MKQILTFLLLLTVAAAGAQTGINIEDAGNHIGDSVTIKAKVYGVKHLAGAKGSPTLINLGAAYPNQLLTIVIWQNVREKLGYDPAEEKYATGMARVTGKLELYKGKPQVVITNPAQLVILYDEEVNLSELPKADQKL